MDLSIWGVWDLKKNELDYFEQVSIKIYTVPDEKIFNKVLLRPIEGYLINSNLEFINKKGLTEKLGEGFFRLKIYR